MLFPTFDFLLFALPVIAGFWLLADRKWARVILLLVASYFFYMAGPKTEPPPAPWYFAGLLLFSSVLDFVCGKAIHRDAEAADSEDDAVAVAATRRRNLWLTASLVGNLGLLGYFKYFNFFMQAFADMAATVGVSVTALHLDVVLPLGISFYTFQSLSYTIDVWRGRLEPETSFTRFALFVAFFPQLVAGPIVRASQFLPQLQRGPRFTREGIETGAFRIVRGLCKKVILGDFIAVHLTDRIFDNPETFTSPELLVALYGYTLQIYADFSGYSDIAIGLGLMIGFRLPENFDRPYQSRDIAEYWRRWHMTLSSWLRDYLFFQLLAKFGARGGYLAVWLTMFLVGMWHGASWNFVIYANIHAGAMVFNRWNRLRKRKGPIGPRIAKWSLGLAVAAGGSRYQLPRFIAQGQ
ncbi:MAG: MBOAT family O-acyltransferase [Nannocystaceae bacterium]